MDKRILGIDYGHARIGLAISDTYNALAIPYKLIRNKDPQKTFSQFLSIIQTENIGTLLFGYPSDLDGRKTPMCDAIDQFMNSLKHFLKNENSLPNFLVWNETLTSAEAEENLQLKKISYLPKDGTIDIESARIILQEYLNNIEVL